MRADITQRRINRANTPAACVPVRLTLPNVQTTAPTVASTTVMDSLVVRSTVRRQARKKVMIAFKHAGKKSVASHARKRQAMNAALVSSRKVSHSAEVTVSYIALAPIRIQGMRKPMEWAASDEGGRRNTRVTTRCNGG